MMNIRVDEPGGLVRLELSRMLMEQRIMIDVAPGWTLDVERGPDWLFVRVHPPARITSDTPPLADRIWETLEHHFARRLVLELYELPTLPSYLVGQLVMLHKRLTAHGGLMRVCGLSDENQEVLHTCRLESRFPHFLNREEAVLGAHAPRNPR